MPTPDASDLPLDAAVGVLREKLPEVQVVYLFGSRAENQEHAASDVDLAVLAGDSLSAEQRWTLQSNLAETLHVEQVDLVDLREASTVMRMQVVSTGRVLFERNRAERDHFEVYAYSSYALLNEERRDILDAVQERGRIYGG